VIYTVYLGENVPFLEVRFLEVPFFGKSGKISYVFTYNLFETGPEGPELED
jgi:hypothetical protein